MRTPAAILVELGSSPVIEEITIPSLKPGQVLVEILYSGVCHTQLLEVDGKRGPDSFLPHCLGHEATGVVREVGLGVTKVKVDDTVIASWIKGKGQDVAATAYDWNGRTVNAGGITTWSKFSIISENRLVVAPKELPPKLGALLGCAVPTGFGAVIRVAEARVGQSIAVFGAGGVGLCAIAAAARAGCFPIIAVDLVASKLEVAKAMGATHVVDAFREDVAQALKNIVGGRQLDISIEASGVPEVMAVALSSVRQQGGTTVVVGNAKFGDVLNIDPKQLNLGKQLRGTWGGDTDIDTDLPRYGQLAATGRINLEPLMGSTFSLSWVAEAMALLKQGEVIRPIIDMSLPI